MRPFRPVPGSTTSISATTTSARAALTSPPAATGLVQVRVHNAGANPAFVIFGDSTVVATTAHMPIPAGAVEVFTIQGNETHAAAIMATGTSTAYFTMGEGI